MLNKYRVWEQWEIDYLISNYGIKTTYEIAKFLMRTKSAVHNKAVSLGLAVKKNVWTKEREEYLVKEYENGIKTLKEIADEMNTSLSSIDRKLDELGIIRTRSIGWTDEDDFYLEYNWGIKPIKVMAKYLNRTEYAVIRRGREKGYGAIYDSGYYLTAQEISRMLNVSRGVVDNWIESKKLISINRKFIKLKSRVVKPEHLIEFLQNNTSLWNATKVGYMELGYEYDWLIEKRKEDDTLEKEKLNSSWTRKEEEKLIKMTNEGCSIDEISKTLSRTKESILNKRKRLRQEGRLENVRRSCDWTEEMENRLVKLILEGKKSPEIAVMMNKTRTAIDAKRASLIKKGKLLKTNMKNYNK